MKMQKLTLFRGSPPTNSYVWSPFVTKLEARLRLASVPYTLGGGSPLNAPRGKIPYVDIDGQMMGDTTFIINDLVQRGVVKRNETATPVQKAQDLAIRALLEEKVYFYGGIEKWSDNYQTMIAGVLAPVPWFIRWLIGMMAYRKNMRTFQGQGTGLLSGEELATLRAEAWEAIEVLLTEAKKTTLSQGADSKDPFWVLGGEEPTEADATVYGFVASALVCDAQVITVSNASHGQSLTREHRAPDTMKIVKESPTIMDYAERIHDRYFPDYQRW